MPGPATIQKTAIYQKKRTGASRLANKWIQSPRWLLGFGIAVVACVAIYAVNMMFGRIRPGSTWGLGYGIAATVIFLAVTFWAVKRRAMRMRALGRAWPYLQFHVYGGTLFLLLTLMHTGFVLPHGTLTWWLWILSIWIVASGLLGVALQKWIPTLLNSGLTTEVHYDRIPELVQASAARAEKLVNGTDARLHDFYRMHLAPVLASPQPRLIYYFDITGGSHAREKQFAFLRPLLPENEKETLDELQALYRTKLEMDAHLTLQRALRWWMYLHVPISLALIVLLAFHIYTVLYY